MNKYDWGEAFNRRSRSDEDDDFLSSLDSDDADSGEEVPSSSRRDSSTTSKGGVRTMRKVPNARVYIHNACGSGTQISEGDYDGLCNPFALCTGTFCVSCGNHFPLSRFNWDDTGERLHDYRARIRRAFPLLLWPFMTLFGSLVAALIGFALGTWVLPVSNGTLAVVMGVAYFLFVPKQLRKMILGVEHYKQVI